MSLAILSSCGSSSSRVAIVPLPPQPTGFMDPSLPTFNFYWPRTQIDLAVKFHVQKSERFKTDPEGEDKKVSGPGNTKYAIVYLGGKDDIKIDSSLVPDPNFVFGIPVNYLAGKSSNTITSLIETDDQMILTGVTGDYEDKKLAIAKSLIQTGALVLKAAVGRAKGRTPASFEDDTYWKNTLLTGYSYTIRRSFVLADMTSSSSSGAKNGVSPQVTSSYSLSLTGEIKSMKQFIKQHLQNNVAHESVQNLVSPTNLSFHVSSYYPKPYYSNSQALVYDAHKWSIDERVAKNKFNGFKRRSGDDLADESAFYGIPYRTPAPVIYSVTLGESGGVKIASMKGSSVDFGRVSWVPVESKSWGKKKTVLAFSSTSGGLKKIDITAGSETEGLATAGGELLAEVLKVRDEIKAGKITSRKSIETAEITLLTQQQALESAVRKLDKARASIKDIEVQLADGNPTDDQEKQLNVKLATGLDEEATQLASIQMAKLKVRQAEGALEDAKR